MEKNIKTKNFFLKRTSLKFVIIGILTALLAFIIISFDKNGFGYILSGTHHGLEQTHSIDLWHNRSKVAIMALFSGGSLGVAGLLLQKVTKNKLADISILGIGSINIIFITAYVLIFKEQVFSGGVIGQLLPLITLVASLLGTFIVWFFSRSKKSSSEKFIIVGIALQLLFEALAVVLIDPSKTNNNPNMLKTMTKIKEYTIGMISVDTQWWLVILSSSVIGIIIGIVMFLRNKIDLIETNESLARTLGIKVERTKFMVYILVASLAAFETVMVGCVALLGIMAPALARMLFKNKTGQIGIASFFLGGIMVMLASIVSITLDTQLPVGILSTTIVIPYFIYVVVRSK